MDINIIGMYFLFFEYIDFSLCKCYYNKDTSVYTEVYT